VEQQATSSIGTATSIGHERTSPKDRERRLQAYLSRLAEVLGHADRSERVVGYCTGRRRWMDTTSL
jgi:hypothetical protein